MDGFACGRCGFWSTNHCGASGCNNAHEVNGSMGYTCCAPLAPVPRTADQDAPLVEMSKKIWESVADHDKPVGIWNCPACGGLQAAYVTAAEHAAVCRKAAGAVDHPAHYKAGDLEAITVIEALGHGHGFCVGNALKYLWRAGKKTPDALEDLRKARWYVDRAIAALEKGGG